MAQSKLGWGGSLCFPLTLSVNVPVLFFCFPLRICFPSSAVSLEAESYAGITQILFFFFLLALVGLDTWETLAEIKQDVSFHSLCQPLISIWAVALKITAPGKRSHPPKLQLSPGAQDTLSSSVPSAVKIRASCYLRSWGTLSSLFVLCSLIFASM